MSKDFIVVVVNKRREEAVEVQKILTEWGCYIRTRLGMHDDVLNQCSNVGNIFLELAGEEENDKKHEDLEQELNNIEGVTAKLITLDVEE